MSYITKKIQTMFVQTPNGELVLSAKAGEDPEIKMFTGSIEDTDDGMTNDGQMIKNYMVARSYIQGVFAYQDSDVALLQSTIESARFSADSDIPVNVVMTDGSIYSNSGAFVGDINYNGTGTIELKFASAQDWIF
ncbi:MAG: hypothetical protein QNK20_13295 [Aureibaculum sp.]|nr:hypothetical protein [Aureibaculum sp.]